MEENMNSQQQVTVEETRMKKHVSVVAILQIVFGSLNVIGAIAIGFSGVSTPGYSFTGLRYYRNTADNSASIIRWCNDRWWCRALLLQQMGEDTYSCDGSAGTPEHTHRYPQGSIYYMGAGSAGDCLPV